MKLDSIDGEIFATIYPGRLYHDPSDAVLPIDDVIAELETLREDGVRFICVLGGNWRGPKYQEFEIGVMI